MTDQHNPQECPDCLQLAIDLIASKLKSHEIFLITNEASGTLEIANVHATCAQCTKMHPITEFVQKKEDENPS
jgi:hypothetical protein